MSDRRPTAVVTGASSGIGASIADKLLSFGWNVCLISRRVQNMQNITQKYNSLQSLVIKCDLSNESSTIGACKKIIAWCNRKNSNLNLLINNAGFLTVTNGIENHSEKEILQSIASWNKHLAVLLKAPIIFTKYLLPLLKNASLNPIAYKNGLYDGCIINISSIASFNLVKPQIAPYCTSKAALNQFTKLTSKELSAKYKIRCNAIKFGAVDTQIPFKGGWTHEGWNDLVDEQSIGRIGNMNDSDQIMLFLADKNKSGFITGATINVDGGYGSVGCTGNEYGKQSKL